SQPRSLAAEAFPCLNKFTIKHKQIYSHKKPQRLPSLELRSTLQRNNRNVLMDWDNSIQNKFPRNLKPAGFPKGCPLWQTEKEGGVWGGRKTCSVGVSFLP
ncbi:MAG TPA: hypothetical protein DHV15_06720, partial [Treponema sp.]|nr:hypothetical protein [Treponema sp.]